jgi:ABC-type transport system involved in multi-copper enzyme maturation permease subunit
MPILTIARLTLHETSRRKLLLVLAILTVIVALMTSWVFHKLLELPCGGEGSRQACLTLVGSTLLILLFFVFGFVLALGAAFVAAPAIAADIESGILLSMATRPIRRSDVVLGKWLGLGFLLALYGAISSAIELVLMKISFGYVPPHPVTAVLFILAEGAAVLTLALFISTRLSGIVGGVIALVLYGASWLGGVIGAVGTAFGNHTIENIGTVIGLIMPTDGLWRGAIYNLEPVALIVAQDAAGRRASANPFFVSSGPTTPFLLWALLWAAGFLGLAVWSFYRREL